MRHEVYRPGGFHHFRAGLDANGNLVAFRDHFVSFGTPATADREARPAGSANMRDSEFPARFVPNLTLAVSYIPFHVTTGAHRAPGSNALAFVMQSFIDELAHAAGKDPLAFQLELLARTPIDAEGGRGGWDPGRMTAVLKAAASRSRWGQRNLPRGTGMGLACYYSHSGYFAEVAEVAVDANKRVKVNNVWVAGDIGRQIINPMNAASQVEGSVIDGAGQLMSLEITIENGAVVQGNFDDYPLIRMRQAPMTIDVQWVTSDNDPTGLGEPALPPILPAIASAIFAATGERVRSLPLSRHGYSWA
jgi:isoquinoline 1-oxidoreductase beta subunit